MCSPSGVMVELHIFIFCLFDSHVCEVTRACVKIEIGGKIKMEAPEDNQNESHAACEKHVSFMVAEQDSKESKNEYLGLAIHDFYSS